MQYEYDFELTSAERERLDERRERLRDVLPRLREAAEGEEPLSNVMDREQEP
jgi:hypothetical protein